jgi:hypothetical protein
MIRRSFGFKAVRSLLATAVVAGLIGALAAPAFAQGKAPAGAPGQQGRDTAAQAQEAAKKKQAEQAAKQADKKDAQAAKKDAKKDAQAAKKDDKKDAQAAKKAAPAKGKADDMAKGKAKGS